MVREPLRPRRRRSAGETSPHYTNLPRFTGVAERMRELLGAESRIVYMVRDPIDRMLSHYLHNVGGGYESRPLEEALGDPDSAYVARSRYAMQLEPYLEGFERRAGAGRRQREELGDRARGDDAAGVRVLRRRPGFTRRSSSASGRPAAGSRTGGFRLMDRAVRLPGLRALDRNFDRLPESLRWLVERLVHDPGRARRRSRSSPGAARATRSELLADDVAELERITGRSFGWFGRRGHCERPGLI